MAITNDSKSEMSQEYGVVNTNRITRAGHDDWLFFVLSSYSFTLKNTRTFCVQKPRICILVIYLNFPHKLKHAATVIFSSQTTLNVLHWEKSCLPNSRKYLSIRTTLDFENGVTLEILSYLWPFLKINPYRTNVENRVSS